MVKHFHPISCWKNMFDCLATSLNFALKWFSMFDLEQTIYSCIILHYQQMINFLASLTNKTCPVGKKKTMKILNIGSLEITTKNWWPWSQFSTSKAALKIVRKLHKNRGFLTWKMAVCFFQVVGATLSLLRSIPQ